MDEKKKYYKYCIVPSCKNNIKNAPKKVYFHIPRDAKLRSIWFKAMNRREELSPNSSLHCCEDHFNIEEDTENYMRHKVMSFQKGQRTTLRLKKGVIPHIFQSQKVKVPTSERMAAIERKTLVEDALYEYALKQHIFTAEKLGESSSCHVPSRYITILPMKTAETSNIKEKIFTGNPVDNVSSSSYLSPLSTDFEPDGKRNSNSDAERNIVSCRKGELGICCSKVILT